MNHGVTLEVLVREGVAHVVRGNAQTLVRGVHHDSREVEPGDLFVALAGASHDGSRFVRDAVARGAAAVLVDESFAADAGVPLLVASSPRKTLALAAAVVYGHPTFALDVVGVTGTNGKTTTTHLVAQALESLDQKTALVGTVLVKMPGFEAPAPFTTPEGDAIARIARDAVSRGATHFVMEVSSHALAQYRVEAVRFRVAAFTNLTQDHLDFHGTMEAYGAAKARLFHELAPGAAVINVDDAFGAELAKTVRAPLWRVSQRADADAEIRVLERRIDREGVAAELDVRGRSLSLRSPLVGAHNLENLLVALGCGAALGFDLDAFVVALGRAVGAPGRLERVVDTRGVGVFIDYAHTPDALSRALVALRGTTPGRLVAVFGCGGDRDRKKRPLMGQAAARGADLVVVTTDNPRTESPAAILDEIEPSVAAEGLAKLSPQDLHFAPRGFVVIENREQAISYAIGASRVGDTVLIAGKGHEPYQIVGTEKRPFDDRLVAQRAIASAGGAP